MGQDSKVKITMQEGSPLVHLGNEDYSSSYADVDFKGRLVEAEARVVQVACAVASTLFVCEDERLFQVGKPFTYNERWHDAYQQAKTFAEVQKPANCSDFKKVVASGSNRLILTKSGELFC